VLHLLDAGEQVVVMDNLATGFRSAVDPRSVFVQGDVSNAELVRSTLRAHSVADIIHFAGSVVVPESMADPLKYYANNTAASRNLIEAAVREGVKRFIFSSTAAVYGMAGSEPVTEDAPLSPMSPYGRSKLMTEQMLVDVASTMGLKYGILRYFNVAGADPAGRVGQSTVGATHLIKVAIQAALGMRPRLEIFGTDYPTPDGTCLRDYIHVTDLISAHGAVLAYLRAGADGATMNCGYGRGTSVREVIDTVRAVSGCDFEVREAPRRAGDPPAVVASVGRLRQETGWRPERDSLLEIVQAAWAWEKKLQKFDRVG